MVKFIPKRNVWILWKDSEVEVVVPTNPLWPASYGGWVDVIQHQDMNTPYDNYRLFAKMSVIAASVQKGLEDTRLAPHANIQSNANGAFRNTDGTLINLEEGRQRRKVHIHIFGRRLEDSTWADPIQLATYQAYNAMKHSDDIWSEDKMNDLIKFLDNEIPRALANYRTNGF
jgi:hypothetical protein